MSSLLSEGSAWPFVGLTRESCSAVVVPLGAALGGLSDRSRVASRRFPPFDSTASKSLRDAREDWSDRSLDGRVAVSIAAICSAEACQREAASKPEMYSGNICGSVVNEMFIDAVLDKL